MFEPAPTALPLGELAQSAREGKPGATGPLYSDRQAFVRAMLSLYLRFSVSILALSVTFGDTSPKGRGFAPCFLIYTSISSPSSSEYIPL